LAMRGSLWGAGGGAPRGRRFHMVFIGAGALEARIRLAIADAGVEDRVSMAGFVADLPGAIAACDVALYAAFESEGMSRVLFEYLAMGVPVVATRVGVVPEVLEDGRTALLVPAQEPGPLTTAIERLLEDAALRARLGREAGALARERLSGAHVAGALAVHYARLAPAGGRAMR
jgi:glycosyltransferase involved in cell wall biosynthesis